MVTWLRHAPHGDVEAPPRVAALAAIGRPSGDDAPAIGPSRDRPLNPIVLR